MNTKQLARMAVLIHKVTKGELSPNSVQFRYQMIDLCTPVWVQMALIGMGLLALYGALKLP